MPRYKTIFLLLRFSSGAVVSSSSVEMCVLSSSFVFLCYGLPICNTHMSMHTRRADAHFPVFRFVPFVVREVIYSSKRTLGSLEASLGQKEKSVGPVVRLSVRPVHDTKKPRTTHFFQPTPRGARSYPIAHIIRLYTPSASLSFIGACCVVYGCGGCWAQI